MKDIKITRKKRETHSVTCIPKPLPEFLRTKLFTSLSSRMTLLLTLINICLSAEASVFIHHTAVAPLPSHPGIVCQLSYRGSTEVGLEMGVFTWLLYCRQVLYLGLEEVSQGR